MEFFELEFDYCGGLFFLCSTGLPLVVLLLYWVVLSLAVLGSSVLNKGVETSPTKTQLGPACAQTIHCLTKACLQQAKLF